MNKCSVDPHRFGGERFGLEQKRVVGRAGRGRFASDDHHQGHRHRADSIELNMDHGRCSAIDQAGEAAKLGHSGASVSPGSREEEMVGLVAAQHIVNEIGRESDLTARLALAGLPGTMTPFEGSSRRWLARPIRWSRRDDPLGAPIWTTRSTLPQSMPKSGGCPIR